MRFSTLLLVSILLTIVSIIDASSLAQDGGHIVRSARSRFVIPKLFDFSQFKRIFHKRYNSLTEELARGKLFVARATAAFISMMKYKTGKLSSFRSVNHMSDWTAEQRTKLLTNSRSQLMANLEQKTEKDAIKLEENYIETQFRGFSVSRRRLKRQSLDLNEEPELDEQPDSMDVDDILFVDHRQTGCLTEVKSQGSCLSCSVFASLALAEYLYCQQTGSSVSFAEQYLLDCSVYGCPKPWPLEKPIEFIGEFGLELAADYPFIERPDNSCPFDAHSMANNRKSLGYIRAKEANYIALNKKDFLSNLKETPIVYAVKLTTRFLDYGGGVDLNHGCSDDMYHAMLLVGHGREDGRHYLLFRNSHSKFWGEEGYYKMSSEAMQRCGSSDFGLIARLHFEGHGINDEYIAQV